MEMHSNDREIHGPVGADEKVEDEGAHHPNAKRVPSLLVADARRNQLESRYLKLCPPSAQNGAFQNSLDRHRTSRGRHHIYSGNHGAASWTKFVPQIPDVKVHRFAGFAVED